MQTTTSSPAPEPAGTTAPRGQRSMMIDVVRGIAISLVALGHTDQGVLHRGWWGASRAGLNTDIFIYTFHMPAFFFVSGIFLLPSVEKRGARGFTAEKLRTILYPYVVMMCVFQPLAIAGHFTINRPASWSAYAVSLLTGAASWFLPTIFFVVILGMLLRRVPMPVLLVLSLAVGLSWPATPVDFVDRGLRHFPFLVAGMWTGRAFERLHRVPKWTSASVAAVLAAVVWVLAEGPYGFSNWLFYPLGFLGIGMLLLVARCMGRTAPARGLAWIGFASLSIFLLAPYFQWVGRELMLRLAHTTSPVPQVLVPTAMAILGPAWLYHQRKRLRLVWLFQWPFQG